MDRTRAGPVAVRLVHQQHQVVQAGQVVGWQLSPSTSRMRLMRPPCLREPLELILEILKMLMRIVGKAHRLILNHRTGLVVVVAGDDQRDC